MKWVSRSLFFPNFSLFFVDRHHPGFIGHSHKDFHAECTCSAFRPFAGVLPHHLQGATIQHFANFYLITERFSKNHIFI